jgi:hypothetical protein
MPIHFRKGGIMTMKSISYVGAVLVASITSVASPGLRATTPAGWKVLVDKTKNCQISDPGDWVVDTTSPSVAYSPDKKANVFMHGTNQGQSLDDVKPVMQAQYPPIKVMEDSKSRLFYSYKSPRSPDGNPDNYYVGIPVKGNVCGAQITFKNASLEPVAKQIAESLAAAK